MRMIDADALPEHKFPENLCNKFGDGAFYRQGWNDAIDAIVDNEDTVDVVPVVHGRWRTGSDTQCGISCSVCGIPLDDFCGSIDYIYLKYEPNFCPHCGAVMNGKDGGGNETD